MTPAGEFREQDWQLPDSHAERRARHRTGRENLRALWREADDVDYPSAYGQTYARYHPREDVVLLARWGYVKTVIELTDRPEQEQSYVRSQVATRGDRA